MPPPERAARVPPFAFGYLVDPDIGAINLAQWAFANPARTRGDPADAARAVAAVDYLADELNYPRWDHMSVLTKMEMIQARAEVRQAMGIAPNAPSQLVVNSMIRAASAWTDDDHAAALTALNSPIYAQPPNQTAARLANMPYLRMANVATQHAAGQELPTDSSGMHNF
jgi:hypothetical protein